MRSKSDWTDPQPEVGATYRTKAGRNVLVVRVTPASDTECPACHQVVHKDPVVVGRTSYDGRNGIPLAMTPPEWAASISKRL